MVVCTDVECIVFTVTELYKFSERCEAFSQEATVLSTHSRGMIVCL